MEFGLEDNVIKLRLQLRYVVAIEKQIAPVEGRYPFVLFTRSKCFLLASSSEVGRNEWTRDIAKYIGQGKHCVCT